jgi:hypothetical protein
MTRRRISQKRIDTLRRQIDEQRKWIEQCGGDHAGYIANYGDPGVPPLEDGKPKILSIKPCDVHLFEGRFEPVLDQPNCFFARHSGNGGTAIYKADHDHLVGLETEFEMLTGQRA